MTDAPKRTVSPAAPSRSLENCFRIASKIYDDYGHTEFGTAEIATSAGLSAGSGSANSLVSDLKQYGLITKKRTRRFAVSQAVKDMLGMGTGSIEFKAAAYQLVRNPSVFQRLLDDAKGKLPEEAALASLLRSSHGFSQEKAKVTADSLTKSLEWIGVLGPKRNILEPRPANNELGDQQARADAYDRGEDNGPARVPGRLLSLDIPLAEGRIAHIAYPHDLTVEEAEKIGKVLSAICA